jgi:hypothetical protein
MTRSFRSFFENLEMMNKTKVEGAIEQACSRDGTAIAIARYLCV